MKLQLVPARTGLTWVRQGVRTFARQPLAMTGLFFLFMTVLSILSVAVPVLGSTLALALMPGVTLGLMAASREADQGRFPMPILLLSAFRAGPQRLTMLLLGAWYAAGFWLTIGASALFDGGRLAGIYLGGAALPPDAVEQAGFQGALLVAMVLYLPLSMLFWHAPALVCWHGMALFKSLFFSGMACLRNIGAYTVFGLAWAGLLRPCATATNQSPAALPNTSTGERPARQAYRRVAARLANSSAWLGQSARV